VNWRRVNRAVHRDLGYLCAGLTVVYALTGVLLNHLHDWNPHWKLEKIEARVAALPSAERFAEADLVQVLAELGEREKPLGTFFRTPTTLQIFFDAGRAWVWLADAYAASLGLLAFTGLFVLKGRGGITRRGAVLTMTGLAIPALFLLLGR